MSMSLVTRAAGPAPIPPETRRVAALLAREHTGEILAHLRRRPYLAASEIARMEDIHVATAQRYLKDLAEVDLVGVRVRRGTTRPTEEYWLRTPRIRIEVDLEGRAASTEEDLLSAAKRLGVRDRGDARIVYDTHPATGVVQSVLVLSEGMPRLVEERIVVPAALGRFLTHLPNQTAAPQSVWAVMQHAGLDASEIPALLGALGRFAVSSNGGAATPAALAKPVARPGSARLPDADLEPLLGSFGPLPGLIPEAASLPFVEIGLLEDEAPDEAEAEA